MESLSEKSKQEKQSAGEKGISGYRDTKQSTNSLFPFMNDGKKNYASGSKPLPSNNSSKWTSNSNSDKNYPPKNTVQRPSPLTNIGQKFSPQLTVVGQEESFVFNMSAKEMLMESQKVQKNSLESTTRSKKAIAETAQIGASTQMTLAKQNEQLVQVDGGLDRIDANIKQADHQVRIFLRRMATDKIIMVLLILIIIAIICCIVVSCVVKPK